MRIRLFAERWVTSLSLVKPMVALMKVYYQIVLDSGGLEAAVAGYEREAEMEGCCGNDAVGHVGNNIARNILERIGYTCVHGRDE